MEDNTRLSVWDRVAGETGELLSPVSDATSVKARTLCAYSAYNRGPPKDFKEPMLRYDMERHKGIYPSARCILVETLIDDIPTTEYSVYIFNDVDAADKTKLDMSKLPDWTDEDGLQNIFFPHHSTAAQPVNHYHAVVGSGFPYPNFAQNGSTTVNLRIGPGGVEHEWNPDFGIYPKDVFPFQETNRSYLVAYGTATCIKLKFEIWNDKHEPVVFGPEDSVVKGREVNQMYWHDTARVIIGQPNHPFKISLNFRFVKTQHPDPEAPHRTGVQMFSIRRIRAKTEPVTSSVKGKLVNTYTYTITLMNR
ncbi:hypothetical protein FAUST_11752 [Fusarium austroamericanum]|uniref:Uncharacterized protein n=1 Tax=Fusarium austroamericanum TaxID=282268 RepID=A0AAN6BTX6_FUSAU|nr:hypothetical protein FAUST_11752 [Fusarium austroamericanum]